MKKKVLNLKEKGYKMDKLTFVLVTIRKHLKLLSTTTVVTDILESNFKIFFEVISR